MRTETALDILRKCYHWSPDDFKRSFKGMTVLTTYNNKTYKITDVNYNISPMNTFALKTGETISYIDYYQRKHRLNIRDRAQPMLISRSSEREKRAGKAELFALVPELCMVTGFDETMRTNDR